MKKIASVLLIGLLAGSAGVFAGEPFNRSFSGYRPGYSHPAQRTFESQLVRGQSRPDVKRSGNQNVPNGPSVFPAAVSVRKGGNPPCPAGPKRPPLSNGPASGHAMKPVPRPVPPPPIGLTPPPPPAPVPEKPSLIRFILSIL